MLRGSFISHSMRTEWIRRRRSSPSSRPMSKSSRFPHGTACPMTRVSPNPKVASARLDGLCRLASPEHELSARVVVTTLNASVQRVPTRKVVGSATYSISVGERIDLDQLVEFLGAQTDISGRELSGNRANSPCAAASSTSSHRVRSIPSVSTCSETSWRAFARSIPFPSVPWARVEGLKLAPISEVFPG